MEQLAAQLNVATANILLFGQLGLPSQVPVGDVLGGVIAFFLFHFTLIYFTLI